jgi:uncharacterized YccA/Bax inhibitor family protein
MNCPVEENQLFARYWRTFLPVWLIPVPILAAILFGDFFSSPRAVRVLSYFVGAIILYVIGVQIPPLGLWRRGEITYSQMFTLTMPMAFVGVACVLIGYFIHAHLVVESDSSNQTMKPTAPLRCNFSVFATTPCRGLSLSR